jgi:hypothetical protein
MRIAAVRPATRRLTRDGCVSLDGIDTRDGAELDETTDEPWCDFRRRRPRA